MTPAIIRALQAAAQVVPLVTRVEKLPDGRWSRFDLLGIPVWDRARGERRRARRAERRAARKRDAP